MNVGDVSEIRGLLQIDPSEKLGEGQAPEPSSGPSFAEALEGALETVDKNISASEQTATDYLTGRGGDLHNVLIDMERADLSFKTMVEVRNKLLDAYREIMRMQV